MIRTKKTYIVVIIGLCAVLIGLRFYLYHVTEPIEFSPTLSENKYFIAHATGSIDGYTYLNCKESLLNSLGNGYKYIEIDLQYTSDSILVCVHDWEQFNKMTIPDLCGTDSDKFMKIPSLVEFKTRMIYGRFTPLSLSDVISIQKEHPFTIVTDRICDTESFNKYFNKEDRRNVMVEAFTEEDYKTLHASGYTPMLSLGCIDFYDCLKIYVSHIFKPQYEWIAVEYHSNKRGLRLLKRLHNLKVAAYTVNSPKFFRWHLGSDIDLIYTDNWDLKKKLNTYQDNSTR
jgi:hypothetical protein